MPTADAKPLVVSDLVYSILKLLWAGDYSFFPDRGTPVPIVRGESHEFWMQAGHSTGSTLRYWKARGRGWPDRICYQVQHRPSRTLSPIFDHKFRIDSVRAVGGILFLGPMRLYPAEQVWPELTRRGYYGELPQFYE